MNPKCRVQNSAHLRRDVEPRKNSDYSAKRAISAREVDLVKETESLICSDEHNQTTYPFGPDSRGMPLSSVEQLPIIPSTHHQLPDEDTAQSVLQLDKIN